ncbi:TPA: hypothetical protein N0F65_011755 [Lagenidium giganteum]|uniref:Uncharacterized protein n=1 Tax=Lagenidium giganteum TaxID=4803 RepID=A0AAV2YTM2_9STRA|nr:TPA: hypothetical protein N0F65_011755 [Lagenidium giganteum]
MAVTTVRPDESATDNGRGQIGVAPVETVNRTATTNGSNCSRTEREQLLALVNEFASVTSGQLGRIAGDPYVIPVKPGARPTIARPFPLPDAYPIATKDAISKRIKLSVLEPNATFKWASPALVIPKKEGSVRLVCDFCKANTNFERQYLDGIQSMKSQVEAIQRIATDGAPTIRLHGELLQRWRRRAHMLAPLKRLTSAKVTLVFRYVSLVEWSTKAQTHISTRLSVTSIP